MSARMNSISTKLYYFGLICFAFFSSALVNAQSASKNQIRQRISINEGWRFYKYDSLAKADNLLYDVRPKITGNVESSVADAKPTEAVKTEAIQEVLKPWILPTG